MVAEDEKHEEWKRLREIGAWGNILKTNFWVILILVTSYLIGPYQQIYIYIYAQFVFDEIFCNEVRFRKIMRKNYIIRVTLND